MEQPLSEIQSAIDQILNIKSSIRKKRKTQTDKKKELFVTIVNTIEKLINRQSLLHVDLDLDFSKYDEAFLDTIDALIVLHFGKEGAELIAFYLWDRLAPDGTVAPVLTADGVEVFLESAEDLWELLLLLNPGYGE